MVGETIAHDRVLEKRRRPTAGLTRCAPSDANRSAFRRLPGRASRYAETDFA
jgi:hypothetical protein